MKKKILLSLMTAMMILAAFVTGCGKDNNKVSENGFNTALNHNQLSNVSIKSYSFINNKLQQAVNYVDDDESITFVINNSGEIVPDSYFRIYDGVEYVFTYDQDQSKWSLDHSYNIGSDLAIDIYLEMWEIGKYSDYLYSEVTHSFVSGKAGNIGDDESTYYHGSSLFFEKNQLKSFQRNYVLEGEDGMSFVTNIHYFTDYGKTKVVIPAELQELLDGYFK